MSELFVCRLLVSQMTARLHVGRTVTWRQCSSCVAVTVCRCAVDTPSWSVVCRRRSATVVDVFSLSSVTSVTPSAPPGATPALSSATGCVRSAPNGLQNAPPRRGNSATSVRRKKTHSTSTI